MKKADELLELFKVNDLVQQTRNLKRLIEADSAYQKRFEVLLRLQQTMVMADQSGHLEKYDRAQNEYRLGLADLISYPAVGEYLNCTEELGSLAREITEILSNGLKIE